MKTRIATTLLWALAAASLVGQKLPDKLTPKILIMTSRGESANPSRDPARYVDAFKQIVAEKLQNELTCAEVITDLDIAALITHDRERTLLTGGDGNLAEIGGALGADYLITFSVTEVGSEFYLDGGVLTPGNAKTVARSGSLAGDANALAREMDKYADQLAQELLAAEICPYRGKITIKETVAYEDRSETRSSLGDNCGATHRNHRTVDKQLTWELEKRRRVGAQGTMHLSLTEDRGWWESENCVLCSQVDGDNVVIGILTTPVTTSGGVTTTEKTTTQGLGRPKGVTGPYPATAAIKFDIPNGTYTVTVKGISEVGSYVKDVIETANNPCPRKVPLQKDHESHPYQQLLQDTFGPYPGKPGDKVLRQSAQESYTSEDGKGKTTNSIEFELAR